MGFLLPAAGMKGRIPAFPLPGGYSSLTRGGVGGGFVSIKQLTFLDENEK